MTEGDEGQDEARKSFEATLEKLESQHPFGPTFFLRQLRAFIGDRCPDPGEGLPAVRLHLADGETLDVCHVIAISIPWIALAVREPMGPHDRAPMRTEFVPYGLIMRVTARSEPHGEPHVGFNLGHSPELVHETQERRWMRPEEAIRVLSRPR